MKQIEVKLKFKKLSFFLVMLAAVAFFATGAVKVYASSYSNFNDYYISLNGGLTNISSSGLSSGGTYNLSFGKNFNLNRRFVIGSGAMLGYSSNGSYTVNNYDGYGDNAKTSIDSVYYGVFVKGGYDYKNIMPFVKLGYIGYSFGASYSYSGPSNSYATYSTPITSEGGLLYGAGVEYLITPNWGVTVQYFGASLSVDKVNNFTLGVDFNF